MQQFHFAGGKDQALPGSVCIFSVASCLRHGLTAKPPYYPLVIRIVRGIQPSLGLDCATDAGEPSRTLIGRGILRAGAAAKQAANSNCET